MVNSSAGVGEGVGVCALNQPARDKTATTTRRKYLCEHATRVRTGRNGSNQAFDLSRVKATNLRNTSFSSHLLLTVYRKSLVPSQLITIWDS